MRHGDVPFCSLMKSLTNLSRLDLGIKPDYSFVYE
jgi:hypothetical protein